MLCSCHIPSHFFECVYVNVFYIRSIKADRCYGKKEKTQYLLIFFLYLYELLPPLEQSQERKMQNLSGHGRNNQHQLLTSDVHRLCFLKSGRQKIISKSQTMKEKNSFDKLLKVNKSPPKAIRSLKAM